MVSPIRNEFRQRQWIAGGFPHTQLSQTKKGWSSLRSTPPQVLSPSGLRFFSLPAHKGLQTPCAAAGEQTPTSVGEATDSLGMVEFGKAPSDHQIWSQNQHSHVHSHVPKSHLLSWHQLGMSRMQNKQNKMLFKGFFSPSEKFLQLMASSFHNQTSYTAEKLY